MKISPRASIWIAIRDRPRPLQGFGLWAVSYNAQNRPVRFTQGETIIKNMKKKLLVFTLISNILLPSIAAYAENAIDTQINIELVEKKAQEGDAESQLVLANHYITPSQNADNQKKGLFWLNEAIKQKHPEALYLKAFLILGSKTKVSTETEYPDYPSSLLKDENYSVADALELLRASSALGNKTASYTLAVTYFEGSLTEQNIPLTIKWLKKAWEQGSPQAASFLGMIEEQGLGGTVDIDKAIEYYKQAGSAGNTQAFASIGFIYYRGTLRDQDVDEAIHWVNKGIKTNTPACLAFLGSCHAYGIGVKWDNKQAIEYLTKASEQGYVPAIAELGNIHMGLTGGIKDAKKAFFHYSLAAQKGDIESQRMLGIMYMTGDGIDKDVNEAARWLNTAWQQGDIPSLAHLGLLLLENAKSNEHVRMGIEALTTSAGQSYAPSGTQLAIMYHEGKYIPKNPYGAYLIGIRCATYGNPEAQRLVANLYETGTGVTKNLERATYWKQKFETNPNRTDNTTPFNIKNTISALIPLAAQGDTESQWKLAEEYILNNTLKDSCNRNVAKGLYWLTQAAKKNHPQAITTLSQLYQSGQYSIKDEAKGLKLLEKAAIELGHPEAYAHLSNAYLTGTSVKQDYKKAFDYAIKGASKNDKLSQAHLASMYLTGSTVPQDIAKAKAWFEKSARNGDSHSQTQMGKLYLREENITEALNWLRLACDQSNMEAIGLLGICYCTIGTTNEDKQKGLSYLNYANQEKTPNMIYNTGLLYEKGSTVIEQDIRKAHEYFREAARLGDPDAIEKLKTIKTDH